MSKKRLTDVFFKSKNTGYSEEDQIFSKEIDLEDDFRGLREDDLLNKILAVTILLDENMITGCAVRKEKDVIRILTKQKSEAIIEEVFNWDGKLVSAGVISNISAEKKAA